MRDEKRIRGFDGLRGLAVTGVIVSHITPNHLAGGWIGVDVFFVLSGYLITSLLAGEWERTGRIALVPFYLRRALRLYPPLILMVAVCAPWAGLFGNRATASGYLLTAAVALTYMSDIAIVVTGTTLGGFLHTWSLAVEEHFYLLWPAVLLLALRRRSDALRWAAIGSAASLALLLTTVHTSEGGHAPRLFFAPQTRAYELLLGCVVALWSQRRGGIAARTGTAGSYAGGTALVGLFTFISLNPHSTARHVEVAASGLAAALVVGGVAASQNAPLTTCLEAGPLRWLGRVSYGAYLYHIPALSLTWHYLGDSEVAAILVAVPVTLALAGLSFRYVERPLAARGKAAIERRYASRRTADETVLRERVNAFKR
jgi:peptidoglycan/LPS O-acetylase OafA/YrhL